VQIRYEVKVLVPNGNFGDAPLQALFEVWLDGMFSGYHTFEVDGASTGWGAERMRAYCISFVSGALTYVVDTSASKVKETWPLEEAVYVAVTRLECDPIR